VLQFTRWVKEHREMELDISMIGSIRDDKANLVSAFSGVARHTCGGNAELLIDNSQLVPVDICIANQT